MSSFSDNHERRDDRTHPFEADITPVNPIPRRQIHAQNLDEEEKERVENLL